MNLGLFLALVAVAACGDSDGVHRFATPTPTGALPTVTPTQPGFAGRPPEALPPGPPVQQTGCTANDDSCDHTHTSLLAIAHAFTNPDDIVLYRVTVDTASTGTDWGDGSNGFFYQAVVNGDTTSAYVPFNGMAVGDDNGPMLPQFTFIVEVDVGQNGGESGTALEIDLCATDYAAADDDAPPCTRRLWTDAYSSLPVPAVGLGPADDPFSVLSAPAVLFDAETGSSIAVPNTGVYPGVLEVCPSLNGSTCASAGELSNDQLQWFYDHLVFFDLDANPYTNDIFDDGSAQHRSIGVLTLEEAAYPISSTQYRTRYGGVAPLTSRQLPEKQFFFYTINASSTSITVGVQYLYDSEDCNGNLNSVGCGSSAVTGEVSISPAASVAPQTGLAGNVTAFPANQNDLAGTVATRAIAFEARGVNSVCTGAVDPLAENPSGASPNRPNYVIDDSQWNNRFAPALYYVLPSGFGNCDLGTTQQLGQVPFCERSDEYAAYVPEFTRNVGSSPALVDGFTLADQYQHDVLASSDSNSLIWFDNCGYGYEYEECTSGCTNTLGSRKTLPTPPDNGKTYTYTVVNSRPAATVFAKECCATFYQKNQQTGALEPPEQIHSGFGVFAGVAGSFEYQTLFSDESIVAYDAATGEQAFKLRLNANGASAVFGCGDGSCQSSPSAAGCPSVTVMGSDISFTVELTEASSGDLGCASIGPCPFGTTESSHGTSTVCTLTTSSFLFGLPEWIAENSAIDWVELRAWGGAGKELSPAIAPGPGGARGLALTTLDPGDSKWFPGLYAYVGRLGGSSTILSTKALSASDIDFGALNLDPFNDAGILLIGPGGGSGGSTNEGNLPGGSGGAGAVVVANAGVSAQGAGADGGVPQQTVVEAGTGGNSDGDGNHGSGGGAGTNGIGGWADGGAVKWKTNGSLIPPTSWTDGRGGENTFETGGAGGGGFGGGGGGDVAFGTRGAGGGGGGGWAVANSILNPSNPPTAAMAFPPSGSDGAVQLVYGAAPTVAVSVNRGQLTATGQTTPSECLDLPGSSATVLDNGWLRLVWQGDGNLVLRNPSNQAQWAANTADGEHGGNGGRTFCFQGDGNLVIRNAAGNALWASNTADGEHGGNGGETLTLEADCNLAVRNSAGTTLFNTHTSPCQ